MDGLGVRLEAKLEYIQQRLDRVEESVEEIKGITTTVAVNNQMITNLGQAFNNHMACHKELDKWARYRNWDIWRVLASFIGGGILAEVAHKLFA